MLGRERADRADRGELRRVVAAMLQVVDDHRGDSLFIATSNHPAPHVSAQAQIVELESPDESAPSEILNLKLRSVRHDFDVTAASEQMEGYSAAEVEAIALDAIRLMVRQLDNRSTTEQIAYAIDLGEARRQIVRRSQGKSPSRQLEAPLLPVRHRCQPLRTVQTV